MSLNKQGKMKVHREVVKKALQAVRRAKQLCPVDTGRLRASITAVDSEGLITGRLSPPSGDYVVRIGTNVEYAEAVERGTMFMEAQPFLRPAILQVFGEVPR